MQKEDLLTILEYRVLDYLRHGGNFGDAYGPRRCDYIERCESDIHHKIIEVEIRLEIKFLELSKGLHHPELEVEMLKTQLLCEVEKGILQSN